MSFDLTTEEKVSLVQQRLKSFQAEKFQHELNKQSAEAINDENAAKNSQDSIDILNAVIQTHLDVLSSLSE